MKPMASCNPFCCCVWQHSRANGLYPAAVKSLVSPGIPFTSFIRLSALSSARSCTSPGFSSVCSLGPSSAFWRQKHQPIPFLNELSPSWQDTCCWLWGSSTCYLLPSFLSPKCSNWLLFLGKSFYLCLFSQFTQLLVLISSTKMTGLYFLGKAWQRKN